MEESEKRKRASSDGQSLVPMRRGQDECPNTNQPNLWRCRHRRKAVDVAELQVTIAELDEGNFDRA